MSSSLNVRDKAIEEVRNFAEAYGDEENGAACDRLLQQLRDTSDDAFAKDLNIYMPNGYRISIEPASCLDARHMNGVELGFDGDRTPNP